MKRLFIAFFIFTLSLSGLYAQSSEAVVVDSVSLINMRTARAHCTVGTFPTGWTSSISVSFVYSTEPMPTFANGGSWRRVGSASAGRSAQTTLISLTPNTTYYVRAALHKMSTPRDTVYSSNQIVFTTLPADPGRLTMDTVVNIGLTYATFRATHLARGSFPYTGDSLGFIYGTDSTARFLRPSGTIADSNFVCYVPTTSTRPLAFSTTLPEGRLTPSTQYYVRAFYITRFDTLFTPAKAFRTTSACDNAPERLTMGNIDITSAELIWTPAVGQTDFELSYGPVGISPQDGQVIQNVQTPYTLTGLTGGRQYTAYVRSVCPEKNSPWSNFVTFTTEQVPCANPIGLQAKNVGATLANVTWTPGNASQTKWEVQLAKSSQAYPAEGTQINRTPEAYFAGLTPLTSYKTRVRAVCGDLTSDWSEDLTFNTTAVGLDEIQSDFPVSITPNPTKGKLFLNAGDRKISSVQIFNLAGTLLLEQVIFTEEINIAHFPKGWYVLKIVSDEQQTVAKVLLQ